METKDRTIESSGQSSFHRDRPGWRRGHPHFHILSHILCAAESNVVARVSDSTLETRSVSSGHTIGTVSLPDLVALNDEMAALVRAGTPLEQGLVEFGAEMPGRLGDIATRLGQRLQAGEGLAQILADKSIPLPPVWTAMVIAGIRSGRLGNVLESLASTGRRVAETRRIVVTSLIYPTAVMIVAYLVFTFLVVYLAPILFGAYFDLTGRTEPIVRSLAWLSDHPAWLVLPPVVLGLALLLEWTWTRRGFAAGDGPISGLIAKCWPAIGGSRRDARLATFTEILSLLVRERTPLSEALVLAGDTCGDKHLRSTAIALAQRFDQGQSPSADELRGLGFPPLLGFMLVSGANRTELGDALASTAHHYRERSTSVAAQTALVLPIVLSSVVGGAVTLVVGLAMLLPVWRLIMQLGSAT
jgi:general secretion pathway protein F